MNKTRKAVIMTAMVTLMVLGLSGNASADPCSAPPWDPDETDYDVELHHGQRPKANADLGLGEAETGCISDLLPGDHVWYMIG